MRTLREVIDAGEDAPYRTRYVQVQAGHDGALTLFRCRCGRRVYPDMMLEVRPPDCEGVPEALCGHDRFRCDGCWRGWLMRREIDPDELRAATNQPPRRCKEKPV